MIHFPTPPEKSTLLDRALHRILFTFVQKGMQDEPQLKFFTLYYLGYTVPDHANCPNHVSPFEFYADIYFERVKTILGFANRNGGKTIIVAMANVAESTTKQGIEIVSAGAIKNQADKGYEYYTNMLLDSPYLSRFVVGYNRARTVLANGSVVRITTGTWHGLNSPHPTKFRCDEVELMHYTILQEGLQMSISKGKYKAGDCLTSTRKFGSGTMQKLLDEAPSRGIKVASWCIWEILETCTRQCQGDPEFGDCPLYLRKDKDGQDIPGHCHGRAHTLPPGGFYKIDDFVEKVKILDDDTIETQWFNLRPGSGTLVYGKYYKDEEPFIVMPEEAEYLLKKAKGEQWTRIAGTDFGSNFWDGCFMFDRDRKIWYLYHEYWYSSEHDLTLKDHATNIRTKDPLVFSSKSARYGDPTARQAIVDMEDYGVPIFQANNDVYTGISYIKLLFRVRPDGYPGLRIFSTCVRARFELSKGYKHPIMKDGTPNTDLVVKKDDHAVDGIRYALYSHKTIGTTSYKVKRLRGT